MLYAGNKVMQRTGNLAVTYPGQVIFVCKGRKFYDPNFTTQLNNNEVWTSGKVK